MSEKQDRYHKTTGVSKWIAKNGTYVYETQTITLEFDRILHDWIKTKTETTEKTLEEMGFKKEVSFEIISSIESEGIRKKKIVPFKQSVVCKIKPEHEDTFIFWSEDSKKFFVTQLCFGITYALPYSQSDDYVSVSKTDEEECSISEANEIARKYPNYVHSKNEEGLYQVNVSKFIDKPQA